jgi:fatty acid synthase
METTIHDDPDDIVISGISGKFPNSDSMKELQDNLLNKVDLGSDDERRWLHGSIHWLYQ